MVTSSSPKAEVSKKERVNVSLSSDLLEALDSEAARRKMDRSALLTEYARTGLNGGVAPAPVVVDIPSADAIAAAVAALVPTTTSTMDVAPALTMLNDLGNKATVIYREALTLRYMMVDRISERYIDHGASEADGKVAGQDAYTIACDKANTLMGLKS